MIGTTGNDSLLGTDAGETLEGLAGNDTLDGAAGEDTLRGGPGNDLLIVGGGGVVEHYDGGTGDDTLLADLSSSTNSNNFSLFVDFPSGTAGAVESELGRDTFENIENYEFRGIWDARLTGDDNSNELISDQGDDTLEGGAGRDALQSGDGADVLNGGAGMDVLTPGLGADQVTLGAGRDFLVGTASELDGDTVTDFSPEDLLLLGVEFTFDASSPALPTTLPTPTVSFDGATGRLAIDGDGDGTADGTLTLQGVSPGATFITLQSALGTVALIDPAAPALAEGKRVADGDINGMLNPAYGTSLLGTMDVKLRLDAAAQAEYDNAIGVYEFNTEGDIVNVRIVVASVKDAPSTELTVTVADGHTLGLFMVQDGASWAKGLPAGAALSFQDSAGTGADADDTGGLQLMVDGAASGVTVFHAFSDAFNADGTEHTVSRVNATGDGLILGFEDQTGGGDRDFQDVLVEVTEAPAAPNPGETRVDLGDQDQTVATGSGDDVIQTGGGNDTVNGGAGSDQIDTGNGNDEITLGDGDDAVRAGPGNDVIVAGQAGGQDYIDGGSGDDRVEYPSVPAGTAVEVDLTHLDRSADPVVSAILSRPEVNLPTNTPVGLATIGGNPADTDVLRSIENATGGAGDDSIGGNSVANLLDGAGGNDTLRGRLDDDTLRGGDGNDSLDGDEGSDELVGGAGDDFLDGDVGHDRMILQGNRTDYSWQSNTDGTYTVTDSVANRDGVDTVKSVEQVVFADATVGIWTVAGRFDFQGTSASEEIVGSDARDYIRGEAGDDTLVGLGEEDQFVGGPGNDQIFGRTKTPQASNNEDWEILDYWQDYEDGMFGGEQVSGINLDLGAGTGTDPWGDTDTITDIVRVFATNSDDSIRGSNGQDAIDPFGGNDTIEAGDGWDYLMYHLSRDFGGSDTGITAVFSETTEGSGTVSEDSFGGMDVFSGIEVLRATPGDDSLKGGLGVQEFRGYAGNDTMEGGAGQDRLSYHDAASYNGFGSVSIDLEVTNADGFTTVIDPHGDTDLIKGFTYIRGTGVDDVIKADGADNRLRGEAGNDDLQGRNGNDTLEGGIGNDSLDGGAGDDTLRGDSGQDVITGGDGNDRMSGGADADQFVFDGGIAMPMGGLNGLINNGLGAFDTDRNVIEDFTVGEDKLVLNGGLTIGLIEERDLNSDGRLDTLISLSSGDQIELWDVAALTGENALF